MNPLGGKSPIRFVKHDGNLSLFQAINHARTLTGDIADRFHGGDVVTDLDDHVAVYHGRLAGFHLIKRIRKQAPVFRAGQRANDKAQAFPEVGILEFGVLVSHTAFPQAADDGAHCGVGVRDENGPDQGLEIEKKVPGGHSVIL